MRTPTRSATAFEWTLADLLARAGLRVPDGWSAPPVIITSLTDDSREVEPGGCFVAVRGSSRDGHAFVADAVRSGACAVVVDRRVPCPRMWHEFPRRGTGFQCGTGFQPVKSTGWKPVPHAGVPDRPSGLPAAHAHASVGIAPNGVALVRVDDTREAAARLGAAFHGLRGHATSPRLVGVTGTNGKTTVAWLLRSILRAAGERVGIIGTIEYDLLAERVAATLTTPGPVQLARYVAAARDAGATYCIIEVSSHALDQRRADGLTFAAAVFTNLSGDHLDYHETMDAYWRAKRRLFESLDESAVAVVNLDDPVGDLMSANLRASIQSFGCIAPQLDVRAHIESNELTGSSFVLRGRSFETAVRCPLVGRHNVMNAVAAAATAEALGVSADAIRDGLERLKGVPGRLQRVEPTGCPFCVFVDYAHTDDALRKAIQTIRQLTRERLICVFGCGGDRDRSKRPRMAVVVNQQADVAFVTSDNPRTEDPHAIVDDILRGFSSAGDCRVEVEVDRRRAISAAIAEARPGDTVLIAGKGHENYQLVGDKVLHFDDVEEACACLGGVDRSDNMT